MEKIDDFLAETMLSDFYSSHESIMDNSSEYKANIKELKSNVVLNAKSSNELLTILSNEIELICVEDNLRMQDAIVIILQTAYVYSRAYETKIGNISKVFMSLVTNYNNKRS